MCDEQYIWRDIWEYNCDYGKLPEAIFMSVKLFNIISANYDLKVYDTPNGIVNMYHGIPIKLYYSDKPGYYLVASGHEFE